MVKKFLSVLAIIVIIIALICLDFYVLTSQDKIQQDVTQYINNFIPDNAVKVKVGSTKLTSAGYIRLNNLSLSTSLYDINIDTVYIQCKNKMLFFYENKISKISFNNVYVRYNPASMPSAQTKIPFNFSFSNTKTFPHIEINKLVFENLKKRKQVFALHKIKFLPLSSIDDNSLLFDGQVSLNSPAMFKINGTWALNTNIIKADLNNNNISFNNALKIMYNNPISNISNNKAPSSLSLSIQIKDLHDITINSIILSSNKFVYNNDISFDNLLISYNGNFNNPSFTANISTSQLNFYGLTATDLTGKIILTNNPSLKDFTGHLYDGIISVSAELNPQNDTPNAKIKLFDLSLSALTDQRLPETPISGLMSGTIVTSNLLSEAPLHSGKCEFKKLKPWKLPIFHGILSIMKLNPEKQPEFSKSEISWTGKALDINKMVFIFANKYTTIKGDGSINLKTGDIFALCHLNFDLPIDAFLPGFSNNPLFNSLFNEMKEKIFEFSIKGQFLTPDIKNSNTPIKKITPPKESQKNKEQTPKKNDDPPPKENKNKQPGKAEKPSPPKKGDNDKPTPNEN